MTDPRSVPCRVAARSGLCLPLGPQAAATSSPIEACITRSPGAHRQSQQALAQIGGDLVHGHAHPLGHGQRTRPERRGLILLGHSRPLSLGLPGGTPETYHSAGLRRETATSNLYETRDNLGTLMYVRIVNASGDDRALVKGMNRLRAAHRDLDPGIERYFVTGYHDDEAGVMETYRMTQRRGIGQLIGSTWLFVLALNALLAGVLSALVTQAAGAGTAVNTVLGVMGGLLYFTAAAVPVGVSYQRWLRRSEEPISPTPLNEA